MNMRRFFVLPAVAGIVMCAVAGSAWGLTYAEQCEEAGKGDFTGSYLNARYGYILHYECVWHKLQIGGQEQWFELLCGPDVAVSGEVVDVARYALPESISRGDSVWTAAVRVAASTCAADGPDGSTYCEPAEDMEAYESWTGLRVLKFYQTLVGEDYATDTISRTRLGPYYAIDISQQGRNRLILMSGGAFTAASDDHDEMVGKMVEMLEIVPSPFLE
jgi:hypothetical protein